MKEGEYRQKRHRKKRNKFMKKGGLHKRVEFQKFRKR